METANVRWQEVWLIRHGVSIWNIEQIHQGQSFREPGLSPIGRNQALNIGLKLREEKLAAIHTSPLPRAEQTARLINWSNAYPANIFGEAGLKEISHGIADGMRYQDIFNKYSSYWLKWLDREMETPCFPGGESQLAVQARMFKTMLNLAQASENRKAHWKFEKQECKIIVVAHGGVNKLFLAHVLGLPAKDNFDIPQENACINILLWDGNNFLVKTDEAGKLMINLTDHLGEHRMSPNIKI